MKDLDVKEFDRVLFIDKEESRYIINTTYKTESKHVLNYIDKLMKHNDIEYKDISVIARWGRTQVFVRV